MPRFCSPRHSSRNVVPLIKRVSVQNTHIISSIFQCNFFAEKKTQLQGIEVLSVWEGIVYFRNLLNHMIPRNAQVTILSNYFELETRFFSCFSPNEKKIILLIPSTHEMHEKAFAAIWSKATLLNDAKCTNKLETHNNKNDSYTRLTCTVRLAID